MTGKRSSVPCSAAAALVSALLLCAACGSRPAPAGGGVRTAPAGFAAALPDGTEHRITEVELRTPRSGPSIVVIGADQSVWVALARAGRIVRLQPDGTQREYALPQGSFPVGLLVAPDGAVWFTDIRRNRIVQLDAATGQQREFEVPTRDSWPFQLVRTHDGILYFTERVGNRIGRLEPATGAVTEIAVPTQGAQPAGLTVTPDGQIFFTENSGNRIGHVDPTRGSIEELVVPSPATPGPFYGPAGITSDTDGNVWFAELDGRIGLIRKANRTRIEEFSLPDTRVRPGGVAVDRWGFVWYTGLDGNCIGRFDPSSGRFSEYALPSGSPDPRPMSPPEATARGEMPKAGQQAHSTRPFGIAVDGAGRVWFSEQYGHRLGWLQPPVLEIASPTGAIGEPTEVRARTRTLPANVRLHNEVDGVAVSGTGLDPITLTPGPHRLRLIAEVDGRGVFEARAQFHVNATLDGIERLATRAAEHGAVTANTAGAWKQQLSAARRAVEQVRADEVRTALGPLLTQLSASPGSSTDRRARALLVAHLRHFELFAERGYVLALRPDCAGAGERVVEVRDVVAFHNEAPAGTLTVTALDGAFGSPALPSGQRWSHRFVREGKYEYTCAEGGRGLITVRPRAATVQEFALTGPERVPTVLAISRDGTVWSTAGGGGYANLAKVPLNNRIVRLAPDRTLQEYQTPTAESAPTSIKRASDGTLWFTERVGNNIGHLDPATGTITEYAVPTPQAGLTGIAIDGDDNIWFTEKKASKIGRFDPRSATFHEFATPHPSAEPSTVIVDHERQIWFDERGADNLVRFDPATEAMRQFPVPTRGSRVIGLVADPRGYIWFLELAGHKIGRLDVGTGQVREIAIPTPMATPFKAWLDRHGRLWFTEAFGNKIGVLHGETFFEFALPRQDSMPGGIEIDAQDNVWFTEQVGNAIAVIPGAAALLGAVPVEEPPAPPAKAIASQARR